jgi:hypothetical protein
VFLIWIYVCWLIVLAGAAVTATLTLDADSERASRAPTTQKQTRAEMPAETRAETRAGRAAKRARTRVPRRHGTGVATAERRARQTVVRSARMHATGAAMREFASGWSLAESLLSRYIAGSFSPWSTPTCGPSFKQPAGQSGL